ncbi:MAG: DNA polymerase III subunit delta, partial [Fimbriimonadales bacterium]|nr:DNA polymerase III subunit delta [Fimbriimonadales bacterium]
MEVKYSKLTEEQLRTPARVYLLIGDEPVLQREFLERLQRALQLAPDNMDEATLDARETPVATLVRLLQTLPMESERRLVILHAASRYNASDLNALARLIPQMPPFSCLVILSDSSDMSDEADSSTPPSRAGWQAVVSAVREHGVVVVLEPLRGKTLEARLIETARAQGKRLRPPEAQYLMELVDGVAQLALMELQKVLLYMEPRTEITREDIEQVVSASQQAQVFKLVDAIVAGNTGEALRWLRLLFHGGNRPETAALQTLGLISRQFRLLWGMRLLIEHHQPLDRLDQVNEAVAQKLLHEPNVIQVLQRQPFLRERLRRQAERFPWPRLRKAFQALHDADLALKGVQPAVNPAEVMERL